MKPGRNDPCPCGSGRKYKHCCGKPEVAPEPAAEAHDGAVERAVGWLTQHHRKAFAAALEEEFEGAVFSCFEDDDDGEERARAAMAGIDEALWQQIQINLTEWLLAEGDILVKGRHERVSELLLGPRGPLFTVGQRAWLEQLAQRPLRLYDVTEVVAGTGITLCDALDTTQPPVVVTERAGSRTLRPGMMLGARVMSVSGGDQLSGAIYPFTPPGGRATQERLRWQIERPSQHEEDNVLTTDLTIIEGWLAQFLRPAPLPTLVHAATGEPLVFTTDHYDLLDPDALAAALAAEPGVQGDRELGWNRLVESEDGLMRSLATITAEPGGKRVSVQYKTAAMAASGRAWFDAMAGASVRFRLQEVSDPKGMLARAADSPQAAGPASDLPEGLAPQAMSDALAGYVKRLYANWADDPIPALSGQTPRQALQTASGLERVKGLLRSYEDGEASMAAEQGRSEISYQFLWDQLGLAR